MSHCRAICPHFLCSGRLRLPMKGQVYYSTQILSMLPGLLGEVGWARQPEGPVWQYTFVAARQGSLVWDILKGKGLGRELHPLAAPSPEKPRHRHESELRLIPLRLIIIPSQHLFLMQASASSEETISCINGSQSIFFSKRRYVFHIGSACGHSVKILQSYCQHLSCGNAIRRKLQTNSCWLVWKWRRLCCCHYFSWLLSSTKLSHLCYNYFFNPTLTCFMISSLPTSSHRHKHSLIQADPFEIKTPNESTTQSLCWCIYQIVIKTNYLQVSYPDIIHRLLLLCAFVFHLPPLSTIVKLAQNGKIFFCFVSCSHDEECPKLISYSIALSWNSTTHELLHQ